MDTSIQRIHFNGERVVCEEETLAPPGPGQLRVRTEWTQVSIGTEIAWILENKPRAKPAGLGYSHVGIVEQLGEGVSGVEVGQRVLSTSPHASAWNVPASAVAVPDGVPPDLATLGILGSVAYHIAERAAPKILEPAAIIGQGIVGSLVMQIVARTGARPLIAIDTEASRLERALELGAHHAINAADDDVAARVKEITGDGVKLCIECAANHRAYATGIDILALRGRFVVTSAVFEPVAFRINEDLINRELSIIGAHQPKVLDEPNPYSLYTKAMNIGATLSDIGAARLKVDHLISHRENPADCTDIYERLMQKDRSLVGVLFSWS